MLSGSDEKATLRELLTSDFQRTLLDAAILSFSHTDNPARVNNFASLLREIIRHLLEDLAPPEEVTQSAWFRAEPDARHGISRRSKLRFAIQGGLSMGFVRDELQLDTEQELTAILERINELSKYTHVNPNTFGVTGENAQQIYKESLARVLDIFGGIETLRESTERALHDSLQAQLTETLLSEVNETLDILSTHSTVEEVELERFEITRLTSREIHLEGSGTVEVRLQYGSNSDVAKDIGGVSADSFPLEFVALAPAAEPPKIGIVRVKVDTTSFYE